MMRKEIAGALSIQSVPGFCDQSTWNPLSFISSSAATTTNITSTHPRVTMKSYPYV